MPRRFAALLLAAGAALHTGAALAEDRTAEIRAQYPPCGKQPSEADVTAAGGAHRAAMEAFAKNQFKQAIRLWTDAYSFDCTRPMVFYNLGNAFDRDGDKRGALAAYELLLERAPSEAPQDAKDRAAALKEEIAKEDAEKDALEKKTKKKQDAEPKLPVTSPEPEMEKPLGFVPWIGVGVGGGVLVAGGVLLGVGLSQASSAADECEDPEERTGCPQSAVDDGETGETMSQVGQGLLYGGAGIVVVSIILEFAVNGERPVERAAPEKRGPPVAVTPFVGAAPGGAGAAGVTVRARF